MHQWFIFKKKLLVNFFLSEKRPNRAASVGGLAKGDNFSGFFRHPSLTQKERHSGTIQLFLFLLWYIETLGNHRFVTLVGDQSAVIKHKQHNNWWKVSTSAEWMKLLPWSIWVVLPRTGKMSNICHNIFFFGALLWQNGLIFWSFVNCSEEILSVGV